MRYLALGGFLCLVLSGCVHGETIALWNFNDADSGIAAGFLVDHGTGTMASDFGTTGIGNTTGTSLNAQEGDSAGLALRLSSNANNGKDLTWMVSTEGFESIAVSFAGQRTSTGFSSNEFLYSLDAGNSWVSFENYVPVTGSFGLHSFDLSGIAGLNNNPDAGFRILFSGATGSTGNNRIDNLLVSGSAFVPPDTAAVPEPSTIALMASGILCCCLFGFRRKSRRTF